MEEPSPYKADTPLPRQHIQPDEPEQFETANNSAVTPPDAVVVAAAAEAEEAENVAESTEESAAAPEVSDTADIPEDREEQPEVDAEAEPALTDRGKCVLSMYFLNIFGGNK